MNEAKIEYVDKYLGCIVDMFVSNSLCVPFSEFLNLRVVILFGRVSVILIRKNYLFDFVFSFFLLRKLSSAG